MLPNNFIRDLIQIILDLFRFSKFDLILCGAEGITFQIVNLRDLNRCPLFRQLQTMKSELQKRKSKSEKINLQFQGPVLLIDLIRLWSRDTNKET
jgi:hypothetical protein